MNHWPINNSGPCRPNPSWIDGSQHQRVEPKPFPEAVLWGSVSLGRTDRRYELPHSRATSLGGSHKGSGTPVPNGARRGHRLGRFGRTPCRASTDGSTLTPTRPSFASGPAATSWPTTSPAATGACTAPTRNPAPPARTPLGRARSCGTAWTCPASPFASLPSSPPSGCSSGRVRSSAGSAPRVCGWQPPSSVSRRARSRPS